MKTEFFLTLPLKNSGMICLNLGLSLHVLAVYTPQNVFLHMLRVFFNASAKKLGDDLFKSRSVPVCAFCLHTIERFVCTCCEFFLTLR